MKVEHQPANDPTFFCLDPNTNFRQNLAQKVVIEFPTFHVVLPEDFSQYKIQKHGMGIITQGSENGYLFELENLENIRDSTNPSEIKLDFEENLQNPALDANNPEIQKNILDILQEALEKDALGTEEITPEKLEEISQKIGEEPETGIVEEPKLL